MSVIQTADIIIPNNPEVIKQIKDACQELSASMTRCEAERDLQKEAIKQLAEDTEVPAKYLKKVVKLFHRQNRDMVEAENDSTTELYDKIFMVTNDDSVE
jgi:hypothetical protein